MVVGAGRRRELRTREEFGRYVARRVAKVAAEPQLRRHVERAVAWGRQVIAGKSR